MPVLTQGESPIDHLDHRLETHEQKDQNRRIGQEKEEKTN